MSPDLVSFIHEVALHAGTATGAVRQRKGCPDMRQIDHVPLLAATGGPFLPGKEAALADPKNMAHPADREAGLLRFDEAESHPWRVLSNRWRSTATSHFREEGRSLF